MGSVTCDKWLLPSDTFFECVYYFAQAGSNFEPVYIFEVIIYRLQKARILLSKVIYRPPIRSNIYALKKCITGYWHKMMISLARPAFKTFLYGTVGIQSHHFGCAFCHYLVGVRRYLVDSNLINDYAFLKTPDSN